MGKPDGDDRSVGGRGRDGAGATRVTGGPFDAAMIGFGLAAVALLAAPIVAVWAPDLAVGGTMFTAALGVGVILVSYLFLRREAVRREALAEELAAGERRLRLALAGAKAGAWELDITTGRVIWSDELYELFGVDRSVVPTFDFFAGMIHPEDRDRVFREFEQAVAGSGDLSLEFRVVRPDGKALWVTSHGRVERDGRGGAVRASGMNQDITARRLAEEEVRRGEERLRLATAIAGMGTFDIDLATDAVEVNEAGRLIYGWAAGEPLTFKKVQGHFHPEDREEVLRQVSVALDPAGPGEFQVEQRIFRTDGAVRWIRVRGRASFDAAGRAAVRCLGTYLDVTEAKLAEEGLRESEARLRASERRWRFLDEAAEATRDVADPEQVMAVMAGLLGRHLGATRCAYAEVEADSERFAIRHDYVDGAASTVGEYRLSLFGPQAVSDMRSGRTLVVRDVDRELGPGGGAEMFNAIGIKAVVCCPLVKGDRLAAMMAVHQAAPRDWTTDEIELVETAAERSWAYIERARAARLLRESEERFRLVVQATNDSLWDVDWRTKSLWWQERERPVFGYAPHQVPPGMDAWVELIHPADRPGVLASLDEAVRRRDTIWAAEYRFRRADGRYAYVLDRGCALYDEAGECVRMVGAMTDLTERRAAEEAVEEARNQLQLVADAVPALISYVDVEGRYRLVNRAYEAWFGHPREDVTGRHLREVLGEEVWQLARPNLAAALAGRAVKYEAKAPYRDGGIRWIEVNYVPDAQSGEVQGVVAHVTDVTEHKRLEEALRDADRRKDQFLATLAHELRNPLAPISNALQAWPFVKHDPAELDRLRETMARQVRQMTRLIDDLLDVSRITRGKIALRKERTDLRTVLDAAVEGDKPLIDARGQRLTVLVSDPPPAVDGDVARLVQVFSNLIHNAAKYTGEGGRIEVAARVEPGVGSDGGRVIVAVADDGPGIPASMLSGIFDMFVQVDQTLDRAHGGLGIGLTLVKTLVELHGGTVEAQSEGLGRGSTFEVSLPLAAASAPKVIAASAVGATLPRYRILVVDDVRPSARTLALMLRGLGQETQVAHDGGAALAALDGFDAEVVLLDIAMPGMDGYEACRRIRARYVSSVPRPLLVALTGYGAEEDRRKAFEAGFDRHLVKPTSLDALRELIAGAGTQANGQAPGPGTTRMPSGEQAETF